MRKLLSIIFFVLLCCYARAYDFSAVCSSGQTLYYNITSNVEPYTVEVVPENESLPFYTTYPTGDIEIPETVEYNSITYSVTSIGEWAFCQCSELTGTLTIPESVTNIEAHAFEVCSGLTGDLTIPESVTSIGDYAFSECIGLTSVSLPNSVASIGNDVFWGCSGFTEPVYNANSFVFFPNGYTTEYTIPDGIQRIEGGAFKDCSSLTSITIPESVTFIGDGAFFNCSDLTSFTIPNSITSIGEWAFSDCFGLTTVNFYAQNCTYMPHAWYNATFTTLNIGERVKIISDYAFSGCTGLTEITIPDSVVYIGYETFCSGLITVNFNATSCTTMYQPFTICEALATLNIGENVTNIPEMAFWGVNISNINAYSYTPPTIDEIAFENGVYLTANVYTPCAAANSYRNYQIWEQFANIQGDTTVNFSISVQTENETMGSVTGGGNYSCEAEASITAMPGTGYRFLQWNDGNTDNPRTVVVTADSTFTAGFRTVYTVTVLSNNEAYGSVSGGGTYDEGSEVVVTAIPNQGYRFLSWNDGNTENPRTIIVTSDSTFVANFEQIPLYTITVLSNNEAYGSVSGGGTYEEGTDVIIMAMPNGGYLFDSWEDDNAENPRTITVTSDSTFIADFVKCEITQTIDTTVNNFVTVGNHTFYSTGNYSFAVLHETDCDTIFDINLTVLAEPEPFDIEPNPAKSIVNIHSDSFISHVEFYSPTGQLVMRKEVNGNFAECDVESLVSGVYIVRIFGDESSLPAVYRIVKE